MTSRDFAYWLQGFYEISNPEIINKEQTQMIKKHLSLVLMQEIIPSTSNKEHQEKTNIVYSNQDAETF